MEALIVSALTFPARTAVFDCLKVALVAFTCAVTRASVGSPAIP
jgi:hypothetical protein